MTHFITILPAAFRTAIEMLSLCTSIPIFSAGHIGRSFLEEFERATQNLLHKGRPFILRRITGDLTASQIYLAGFGSVFRALTAPCPNFSSPPVKNYSSTRWWTVLIRCPAVV
jgi:hypothetical protein